MSEFQVKNKIKFIFISLVILFFLSCDDEQFSAIPYVPVSFTVNLNIVNALTVPGNSVYFAGAGYGGIIIYCEMQGSYYAFDAACTYEVNPSCKVEPKNVLGSCPCCKSQFILLGGSAPSKGPAAAPLKQYQVSMLNSYTLRVYN